GFFVDGVDPEFRSALEAAVGVLTEAGMVRTSVELPMIEQAQTVHSTILLGESYSVHEKLFRERGELFGESARSRMALASTLPASAYLRALRVRKVFQEEFRKAMADVDVVVTLTSPGPPARFDEQVPRDNGRGAARAAQNRFRRPFSVAGAPAVSVPCGFTKAGLPIGLQIVGRPGDDTTVLTVANAYQQRTDWHKRVPSLPGGGVAEDVC
uniref:amidase family protein n=1 Tax=Amycolatopsis jejuensis TaxID=330084 RepID=UPI001FDF3E35